MSWPWILTIVALLLLNTVASVRILSSTSAPVAMRLTQLALAWLLPIVGAVICLAFLATDTASDVPSLDRTAFADNADSGGTLWDAPPGSGICGCAGSDSGGGADGGGD